MQRARSERAVVAAALSILALSVGCTSAPKRLYAGPDRDASEVAVLQSEPGASARIIVVDGRRVTGRAFHVAPGQRTVWAKIKFYTDAGDASYTTWTYCQYDVEAEAGRTYTLESSSGVVDANATGKYLHVGARIHEAGTGIAFDPWTCRADAPDR